MKISSILLSLSLFTMSTVQADYGDAYRIVINFSNLSDSYLIRVWCDPYIHPSMTRGGSPNLDCPPSEQNVSMHKAYKENENKREVVNIGGGGGNNSP